METRSKVSAKQSPTFPNFPIHIAFFLAGTKMSHRSGTMLIQNQVHKPD
jgi:hypothetical protein